MSRALVPIAQLGARVQQQGRIRMGVKGGKGQPQSRSAWRFTSPDREAIEQLAVAYGGTAEVWNDPKASPSSQFQVLTDATEVRVFLPPDPLSQWYEQWSGGGCARRCDGITVETAGQDDMIESPCICDATKQMACEPHTRLNVILPDIPFGGVWMLETKGWNAAQEMPGMVDTIARLQSAGMVEAKLRFDKEERMVRGRKRNYVVPRIVHTATPMEMLAGANRVQALGMAPEPPRPALTAVPDLEPQDWVDDPVEAEIEPERTVEESVAAHPSNPQPPLQAAEEDIVDAEVIDLPPPRRRTVQDPRFVHLVLKCADVTSLLLNQGQMDDVTEDDVRHTIAWWASDKRVTSSKELTPDEIEKALEALNSASNEAVAHLVESYRGRDQ